MVKKGMKKPRKLAKSELSIDRKGTSQKRTKAELVVMILAIAKERAADRVGFICGKELAELRGGL